MMAPDPTESEPALNGLRLSRQVTGSDCVAPPGVLEVNEDSDATAAATTITSDAGRRLHGATAAGDMTGAHLIEQDDEPLPQLHLSQERVVEALRAAVTARRGSTDGDRVAAEARRLIAGRETGQYKEALASVVSGDSGRETVRPPVDRAPRSERSSTIDAKAEVPDAGAATAETGAGSSPVERAEALNRLKDHLLGKTPEEIARTREGVASAIQALRDIPVAVGFRSQANGTWTGQQEIRVNDGPDRFLFTPHGVGGRFAYFERYNAEEGGYLGAILPLSAGALNERPDHALVLRAGPDGLYRRPLSAENLGALDDMTVGIIRDVQEAARSVLDRYGPGSASA